MQILGDFIVQEIEPILQDWESFARSLVPNAGLDSPSLRDHAREILLAIAKDMSQAQSLKQQSDKGKGQGPGMPALELASQSHAVSRMAQEFGLDMLIAEFRAMRASVLRRWADSEPARADWRIEELTRFNEAIDEALAVSMRHYSTQLEEARAIILGVLAHDLRSPLNAVAISTQVILHCEPLDPRAAQAAARTLNSVSRMTVLVQDLLDYTATRLGDGLPITRSEGSLEPVLRDVIAEVEAAHPGRNIVFAGSCDTKGQWDQKRIAQMLSNLLTNAFIHGYSDTPVTIEVCEADEGINIEIRNQGNPIPLDVRTTMFESPSSTRCVIRASASSSGLGLGLYIATHIATAHHGALKLASSEKEGTVFSVLLPRAPRAGSSVKAVTDRSLGDRRKVDA